MQPVLNIENGTILVGGAGPDHGQAEMLLLRLANRHGLIAGATGTGKTVTLQTIAEGFSLAGVPVFMADAKGDLGGMAEAGNASLPLHSAFEKRAATIGFDLDYTGFPVTFWDIWGDKGHPVRTTPAEMGPLLLSRLLSLTDAQEGVLNIAFHVADEQGLALLDMDDLTSMLLWVGQNAKELSLRYGNVSSQSVGAIQRKLLVLKGEGGERLFGEPALALTDLMRRDANGRGMINILAAERLMNAPRLYATFLLWLMSELFEQLPEVGDSEKPVLAFFFDEAHLLFNDAPPALVAKIEQVARLIRSKGVSLWFISQNPADLPDSVLGQLGNRVQHALRAFTPKDQKALRQAAENYRKNPDFDTAETIQAVGTGEAVTSFLDPKGAPGIAQRSLIRPPLSRLGPIGAPAMDAIIAASPMEAKYRISLNRESAHEILTKRAIDAAAEADAQARPTANQSNTDNLFDIGSGGSGTGRRYQPASKAAAPARKTSAAKTGRSDSVMDVLGKSLARQIGANAGRAISRGVLGGLFRGR